MAYRMLCSILLGGVLLGGCLPEYPGEPIGTFSITAELLENTCGDAVYPIRQTTTFDVEIRDDNGQIFWRLPDRPLVDGRTLPDDSFRFEMLQAFDITDSCRILQEDRIDIDVSRPAAPVPGKSKDPIETLIMELSGTQRIDVGVYAGDCSEVVGTQSGFVALPCHADIALIGSETEPF